MTLFIFLAAVVICALYLIDLPRLVFAGLVFFVGLYSLYIIGQHALICWPRSVDAVFACLDTKGQLTLTVRAKNGSWHKAELQADTLVTPYLTVLVVKIAGDKYRTSKIMLSGDNCNPDLFRRLRVLIRFSGNDQSIKQNLAT